MSAVIWGKALEYSAEAISRHGRALVGYSGGKESVVLKHLLSPLAERIDFVWVNTGVALPHMETFVRSQGVIELHGNQTARFAQWGLPVRIAAMSHTQAGRVEREPKNRLMTSDWYSCCYEVRCAPIRDYMKAHGITLFIHGQRFEDNFDVVGHGSLGMERAQPLWDWTKADVYNYIEEHALELPEQYRQGCSESFECWNCTGFISPERFAYLARQYPERWEALRPALQAVYQPAMGEMVRFEQALMAAAATGAPLIQQGENSGK